MNCLPVSPRTSTPAFAPVSMQIAERGDCRIIMCPQHGGQSEVNVSYLWVGATGAPTIIVQGGISADRDVCASPQSGKDGWWQDLIADHGAIDLQQFRVLSINWLTADDVQAPSVTSADQANAIAALLDELGVAHVHAFVGSSYGAMVGLCFAAQHGDRLGKLVALAGAHRPHPLATAWRSVQRGVLRLGQETGRVDDAVSLARQLAMTTYRGADEFVTRFSGPAEERDGRLQLPVESWLQHSGRKFVARFDAKRYLQLSESIDLHEVDPAQVRVPTTLIGFDSDRLVPLTDMEALAGALQNPTGLTVIETLYGHDGFLKETDQIAPLLRAALNAD